MSAAIDSPHELAPGTPVVSPRWGYLHHGIYAGGGRVIHYAGFNRPLRRGAVEEVPWSRFARGRRVWAARHVCARFDPDTVVARARSRIGEDHYRFWSNNCEHFVSWCVAGVNRSAQVEAWRQRWQAVCSALLPGSWIGRPGRPVNAD
jgi:hypothetical protein